MDWLNIMAHQQDMQNQAMLDQQAMFAYQQRVAQEQQMMVNNQLLEYGQKMTKTKKKDVVNYLQQMANASMVEQLEEFETSNARHICQGTKQIQILPKGVVSVPTSEGNINVEYFLCQSCRLLLINKQGLWML